MSEILEFLAFALIALCVIAVAVVGAVILVAYITCLTIYYAVRLPIVYFFSMTKILGLPYGPEDNRAQLARRPHTDQLTAAPSYFFGPASADIKLTLGNAAENCADRLRSDWKRASGKFEIDTPLGFFLIVGGRGGVVTGSLAGGLTTAAVAAVHLAMTAAAITAAQCAAVLLRGVDTFKRFIRSVRMDCPSCSETVHPYPVYRCPQCDKVHRDIRPGSHGVLTRICTCGYRMPTSLLTGAGKLVAACPACETPLPSEFGTAAEIIIPFFGSSNVGKTQLMYNIILAINQFVSGQDGSVELGDKTRLQLQEIGDDLTGIGSPKKTLPQIPEANVLLIRLGASERLIYLFDAAGEIYYRQSSLTGIKYLKPGYTLVFVADPLASDAIWNQLAPERQQELAGVRSRASEVQLAYEVTSEHMRGMARRRRLRRQKRASRLAFVISKADLLAGTTLEPAMSKESVRRLVNDPDGLDLGNITRHAEQSFATVEYFPTAAISDGSGGTDRSVLALTQWLLWHEGIRLETS